MSFNPLIAFRQRRLVRAGVGILVLAAAGLVLYKLAHVPQAVDLASVGKFSPVNVKLGEQELIIEGPVVNGDERLLFSAESGTQGIVQVNFDRARLDEQSIAVFAGLDIKLPEAWAPIDYRASEVKGAAATREPCNTRIELLVGSQPPASIRISQLGEPGRNLRRQLQITANGAALVSNLLTQSQDDSYVAPGCQKILKVDEVIHPTSLNLSAGMAEDSTVRFTFLPLQPEAPPWGNAEGFLPLDLGGAPKLNPTDAPPFQARAVSVGSFGNGSTPKAAPALSARSEAGGPLLTVSSLKIFSDHLEVSITGKGNVQIDGVEQTADFVKLIQENLIASGLLAAAIAALLAWVARLVFKAPPAQISGQ